MYPITDIYETGLPGSKKGEFTKFPLLDAGGLKRGKEP
jgi:hypothetical protein